MPYGKFRGGGGRGKGKPAKTSGKEVKKKKCMEDYFYYVGSGKQASDFETRRPNISSIMSR